MDAVFTWVDGSDPDFRREKAAHAGFEPPAPRAIWRSQSQYTGESEARENPVPASHAESRFRNLEELRYALRAIERFAPWFDRIHIVTNGQVPDWLETGHDKISVVFHDAIFPDADLLPCFNSNAIELHLDAIPGLSEEFVYFNDDFFLGRPVTPEDFRDSEGRDLMFIEEDRPLPLHMKDRAMMGHMWAYNHRLLEAAIGPAEDRRMFAHSPQLYRKSLLKKLREVWPEETALTAAHKFRTPFDVALRILYSYLVSDADSAARLGMDRAPGVLHPLPREDYVFVKLGDQKTDFTTDLVDVLALRPKFFCINDEIDPENADHAARLKSLLGATLQTLLPTPSAFEKTPPAETVVPLTGLPELGGSRPAPPLVSAVNLIDMDLPAGQVLSWRGREGGAWRRIDAEALPLRLGQSAALRLIRAPGPAAADAGRPGPEGAGRLGLLLAANVDADYKHPERGFVTERRFRLDFDLDPDLDGRPGAEIPARVLFARYLERVPDLEAIRAMTDPVLADPVDLPMALFRAVDRNLARGRAGPRDLERLEQALVGQIDPFWVCHRRALCYLQMGDLGGLEETLRAALAPRKCPWKVFLDLGQALADTGNHTAALKIAEVLCARPRRALRSTYLRSFCRWKLGLPDPEADALLHLRKADAGRGVALWCDIMLGHKSGIAAILAELDRAIPGLPETPELYVARFRLLSRLGRSFEARIMLRHAIVLSGRPAQLMAIAVTEHRTGNAAGARLLMDFLRAAHPDDPAVQVAWGETMMTLGQFTPEVARSITEAHAGIISETHFWALYNLARAYVERGEPETARPIVARIAPQGQGAVKDLVFLAQETRKAGHQAEAREFLGILHQHFPDHGEVLLNWAEMSINLGIVGEDVEAAIEAAPSRGAPLLWSLYHHARLLKARGAPERLAAVLLGKIANEEEAGVFYDLATAWREEGHDDCAFRLYSIIEHACPDFLPALVPLADLAISQGVRQPWVATVLERARARGADGFWTGYHLLRHHLGMGDADKARATCLATAELGHDMAPLRQVIAAAGGLDEEQKKALMAACA